jgi:predicted phage baseplate assembly protein
MPLTDIQLDDLTYDGLKAELRRRIPRYTPEWTDFNESDPGITLIELFAWLADILVYRINKIPDKAYIKFLQMLNIQLNLPAAAQAYLTFTLTSQDLPNAITIPGGTQVSLASSSGGPVIFATTDNLYACGATLQAVQTSDGAQYTVVTNFNPTDGTFWYPFGQSPHAGSAVYFGFDRAFPSQGNYQFPILFLVNTPAVEGFSPGLPTPALPSANLPVVGVLEYSTATGWSAINVVSDGTAALTQTGVMKFTAPSDWAAVQYGALRKSSDPAYFWMRYRIDQLQGPGYQSAPQLANVLVNTIGALNAVTVQGEILGASDGLPNQYFQLSHYPVLPKPDSVSGIVEVDEGSGYQLWTQVPDFAGQNSNSMVYTLDYSTGTITFGDGEEGKIPQWLSSDGSNLESADTPNIRVTQYQYGAGSAGNSGSNTINSLVNSVPYVASVTNLLPSSGGADEETLADAEDRAPAAIYTQSRAVSAQDFINLALQVPQIERATALPLQRPITQVVRDAQNNVVLPPPAPGVVTVLVVPDGPNPQQPMATDATLTAVAQYLDKYRLATCELYVARPIYRQVEIQATVIVEPTADSGTVQTALTNALLAFYNPLTGGDPSPGATSGNGWPFGGTIYVSDAYRQILDIDGVQYVDGLQIYVDGKLQAQNQDIPLQPFELVYSTQHTLDVSYST